jgi:hypothetical protein
LFFWKFIDDRPAWFFEANKFRFFFLSGMAWTVFCFPNRGPTNVLLGFRVVAAIWSSAIFWTMMLSEDQAGPGEFFDLFPCLFRFALAELMFFTGWGALALMFYFFVCFFFSFFVFFFLFVFFQVVAVLGLIAKWKGRVLYGLKYLYRIVWVCFQLYVPMSLIVALVYWILIHPGFNGTKPVDFITFRFFFFFLDFLSIQKCFCSWSQCGGVRCRLAVESTSHSSLACCFRFNVDAGISFHQLDYFFAYWIVRFFFFVIFLLNPKKASLRVSRIRACIVSRAARRAACVCYLFVFDFFVDGQTDQTCEPSSSQKQL